MLAGSQARHPRGEHVGEGRNKEIVRKTLFGKGFSPVSTKKRGSGEVNQENHKRKGGVVTRGGKMGACSMIPAARPRKKGLAFRQGGDGDAETVFLMWCGKEGYRELEHPK